jgi:hypothetical protein
MALTTLAVRSIILIIGVSEMSNIKYKQRVGDRWHYWGYIDGCFIGPITNQQPKPVNCQFTGFTDIHGVDIYESDIIMETEECSVSVVQFKKYGWVFESCESLYDFNGMIEVIGNIYEHPHLLKSDN